MESTSEIGSFLNINLIQQSADGNIIKITTLGS